MPATRILTLQNVEFYVPPRMRSPCSLTSHDASVAMSAIDHLPCQQGILALVAQRRHQLLGSASKSPQHILIFHIS